METACTYFDLLLWILVVNRTLVHLFSDSLRLECFIPAKKWYSSADTRPHAMSFARKDSWSISAASAKPCGDSSDSPSA